LVYYSNKGAIPRADLLVLAEDLSFSCELSFSVHDGGSDISYSCVLRPGERLDVMLLGPAVVQPGKWTWHAKCAEEPSFNTCAPITVGEQDLRS
jgi:hypothetical protein